MGLINPAQPTKELWVPVTWCSVLLTAGDSYPLAALNAVGEVAYMSFLVPHDFASIVEAFIRTWVMATQAAANWDIYSTYASLGEPRNTHAQSDLATTYNVVATRIFDVNIAHILTNLAAGDIVGVRLDQQTIGHDVNVLGCCLRYN